MIVEVYDALRAIDVPEDKARAAAQALTQDMTREIGGLRGEIEALRKDTNAEFKSVRADIATLRKDMETEFRSVRADTAALKAEAAVTRWMFATMVAVQIAIALKLFLA
jgi:predicted  nucleic acid-binding Zn-ribbon protein